MFQTTNQNTYIEKYRIDVPKTTTQIHPDPPVCARTRAKLAIPVAELPAASAPVPSKVKGFMGKPWGFHAELPSKCLMFMEFSWGI